MAKRVAAHYAYLEEPSESGGEVVAWFRAASPRAEGRNAQSGLINFGFGPLVLEPGGDLDERVSPIVTVSPPRVVRGVLWTVGFVTFRPVLKESGLSSLNRSFAGWLKRHEPIHHNNRNATNEFAYYLEGGAGNYASEIYALPTGAAAIQRGQYFVSHLDGDTRLDTVCRSLRLRGLECLQ